MTTPTPPVLAPFHFVAPPVNPTAFGLYAVTDWEPEGADRFLHGVEVRGNSYPNGQSSGVWNAPWCGDAAPGQLKEGERFPLTLRFEKAGEVQVEVAVQKDAPAAGHAH